MSSLELVNVLEKSKSLGFLGPGPVEEHIQHALKYMSEFSLTNDSWIVDLGTGGGIPALPLLVENNSLKIQMIDSSKKRCAFLTWAITELSIINRAKVTCVRAEEFGSELENRHGYPAVIARSFGPPSTTLECAAPLLSVGGVCIISEPPASRSWPIEGLLRLGLNKVESDSSFAVFKSFEKCSSEFPRASKTMKSNPILG